MKLSTDLDLTQCGLQDIVTASPRLDMAALVPQLREYLTVLDSRKRMFLISWTTVLASVPDVDMLAFLPSLLGGLMDALQDDWREVRTAAGKALQVLPLLLLLLLAMLCFLGLVVVAMMMESGGATGGRPRLWLECRALESSLHCSDLARHCISPAQHADRVQRAVCCHVIALASFLS